MTYKAQLVVRARNKNGAEVIEKVKELASEEGKTFSDMAVDLLARAIRGGSSVGGASASSDEDEDDSEGAAAPLAAVKVEKKAKAKPKKKAVKSARAPLPPEEAGPAVDPSLPPEEILRHYVERREAKGERAAARILVDFFGSAGPAAGGKIKKLLQEKFPGAEFEALMKPIKETEEYGTYTERAIFGEPSPYSQVN